MTVLNTLAQLRQSLVRIETGELDVTAFVALWRDQVELSKALPERFILVLDELLARLESTALFSEESCSFSRGELLKNLNLWLDKAQARLQA